MARAELLVPHPVLIEDAAGILRHPGSQELLAPGVRAPQLGDLRAALDVDLPQLIAPRLVPAQELAYNVRMEYL